jgi:hypothetical protein
MHSERLCAVEPQGGGPMAAPVRQIAPRLVENRYSDFCRWGRTNFNPINHLLAESGGKSGAGSAGENAAVQSAA